MLKWLVLPTVVLAYVAATATGAAASDRDHRGGPDRGAGNLPLSPDRSGAGRDRDGDGLTNRRERRLATNPRRADTDRDGLRDGPEVRRFHTDPRKRDSDGDGFNDRVEVRKGTNPNDPASHPRNNDPTFPEAPDPIPTPPPPDGVPIPTPPPPDGFPIPTPPPPDGVPNPTPPPPDGFPNPTPPPPDGFPIPTPPPPGGFPNPASTGVPAGWTPAQTMSTDLTVTTPGAVVQDIRFTDGANILVKADNVTIRRVDMQGGIISNQYGSAPANCGHNLLVEDVTFRHIPGQFTASDYPVLGEGSYTARRIEVDGRGEGPRLSDCGPVTLEDSFISVKGAEWGTPECDQVHTDGVQAVAGVGATARNNTIVMQNACGTSAWFVVNPAVNTGRYDIDRLLVSGGGYVFRQEVAGSVRGLRIVDNSWVYGPLAEMDCSILSPWDAKLVTIDANYQIAGVVRDQPCS